MQTVFSNSMVAHVWAQQRQRDGRSSNGNLYFNGRVLYSYGSHFPVGIFVAPGGPVVMNADSYSISTGGHQREARAAVRHIPERYSLPALSSIESLVRSIESGRLPVRHRKAALAYLAANWQRIDSESEGAAWLLRAAGSRATWATMRAGLARKSDVAAAKNKARAKAGAAKYGRDLADKPLWLIRADGWHGARGYRQSGLRQTIKDVRESRLATPKAHKRVRAALWQRETALRAVLASAERDSDYHGNAGQRTRARAVLYRLRRFKAGAIGFVPAYHGDDGKAKLEAALALPDGAGWRMLATMLNEIAPLVHMPVTMREAVSALYAKADAIASEREGEEAQRREVRNARSSVLRSLATFNRGRRAMARAESDPMTDRQLVRAIDSVIHHIPDARPWGADRGLELCPALAQRAAAIAVRCEAIADELRPIRAAHLEQWEREAEARREAERAESARVAAMSDDEKRDAWAAGTLAIHHVRNLGGNGALIRAVGVEREGCNVIGGTLETSQGATVPLAHAVKAFAFVRALRAAGKGWKAKASGRTVRVGHFQIDEVMPSGDFIAGCHRINWPETERLARSLGLWDCSDSVLAGEYEGEAA